MCVKNIFILYIILFYCSPSIYLSIIKFNFAWKTIFCSPTCRARHDGSPRGPSSSGWTLRKREDKYCSESHVTDELVIFASTYGMYRCQCEDSPVCVCVCVCVWGGGVSWQRPEALAAVSTVHICFILPLLKSNYLSSSLLTRLCFPEQLVLSGCFQ